MKKVSDVALKHVNKLKLKNPKRFGSRIYTRKGDSGTSAIYDDKTRIFKDNNIFNSLGNLDELSSNIGLAYEFCSNIHVSQNEITNILGDLETIQSRIIKINSIIATTKLTQDDIKSKDEKVNKWVLELENSIDYYDDNFLNPITKFILPRGSKSASQVHICRTICRRSERSLVHLMNGYENEIDKERIEVVLKYVNRMSDYFFTIARFAEKMGDKKSSYMKDHIGIYLCISLFIILLIIQIIIYMKM